MHISNCSKEEFRILKKIFDESVVDLPEKITVIVLDNKTGALFYKYLYENGEWTLDCDFQERDRDFKEGEKEELEKTIFDNYYTIK